MKSSINGISFRNKQWAFERLFPEKIGMAEGIPWGKLTRA